MTINAEQTAWRENTRDVVKRLAPFVKAKAMGGREGEDGFVIRLNSKRTEVELWAGRAKVRVSGSEYFQQAVVTATEEQHSITHKYQVWAASGEEARTMATHGSRFPVAFRDEKEISYHLIGDPTKNVSREAFAQRNAWWDVEVRADVPAHEMCFLVGKDEKNYFISPLRKTVKTVNQAHEELRPDSVPKGSPRVGEWFFVPVDEELGAKLDKNALRAAARDLESYSNHYAPCALTRTARGGFTEATRGPGLQLYVCGWVFDSSGRHSPFWLPDWHLVVRNNEDEELALSLGDGGFD